MPVYEYQCQACGHRFERKQSFTDEPIKVCPECNGAVKNAVTPGIVFKGSGWYITDSRPSPPSESSSSSSSSETKSESKSEAKPAETKTETKKD